MFICFSYFVFTIAIIQIPWSGLLLTSRVANPCTGGASSTMYKAPLRGEKVDKQKRILGIDLTAEAVRNLHRHCCAAVSQQDQSIQLSRQTVLLV